MPRSRSLGVHVQIVAVGAEHAAERVRRIPEVDFDAFESLLEEPVDRIQLDYLALAGSLRRAGQLQLKSGLAFRGNHVVIVVPARQTSLLPEASHGADPSSPAAASNVSDNEPNKKSNMSPRTITSSTSRCGSSRSRFACSRRRSSPVQAPKWVSDMTKWRAC